MTKINYQLTCIRYKREIGKPTDKNNRAEARQIHMQANLHQE